MTQSHHDLIRAVPAVGAVNIRALFFQGMTAAGAYLRFCYFGLVRIVFIDPAGYLGYNFVRTPEPYPRVQLEPFSQYIAVIVERRPLYRGSRQLDGFYVRERSKLPRPAYFPSNFF